jgi:hypothetical protein
LVRRHTFVIGLLMVSCGLAPAAELPELYVAAINVRSPSETVPAGDLQQALRQVLARLVRSEDLDSAGARAILAKPDTYLLQYDYGTAAAGPVLHAEFDAARLNGALRGRGIEVWGAQRPEVLVWLAVEDGAGRRLYTAEAMPELDHLLRAVGETAGLPLVAPAGDATDRELLSLDDIVAGNGAALRTASARYAADTILAGRLVRAGTSGWTADWRLFRPGAEARWQGQATDLRTVLGSGPAGAYTRLAPEYIPRTVTGTAPLELQVVGIASLGDAERVAAYLGEFPQVSRVELLSVGGDAAAYRVTVRGGRPALEQALAPGHRLRPAEDGAGFSGSTYRWLP